MSDEIKLVVEADPIFDLSMKSFIETVPGDYYEGPTHIAPSPLNPIILYTKDTIVSDDIVADPIPEEYLIPSGQYYITENGEFDIKEYETVKVHVGDFATGSFIGEGGPRAYTIELEGANRYKNMVIVAKDFDDIADGGAIWYWTDTQVRGFNSCLLYKINYTGTAARMGNSYFRPYFNENDIQIHFSTQYPSIGQEYKWFVW